MIHIELVRGADQPAHRVLVQRNDVFLVMGRNFGLEHTGREEPLDSLGAV